MRVLVVFERIHTKTFEILKNRPVIEGFWSKSGQKIDFFQKNVFLKNTLKMLLVCQKLSQRAEIWTGSVIWGSPQKYMWSFENFNFSPFTASFPCKMAILHGNEAEKEEEMRIFKIPHILLWGPPKYTFCPNFSSL